MHHYEKSLKASDDRMVRLNKCSSLISVTWVELLWAVYKFFRINNISLKCSFFRCRKHQKSWWNGAAELHISLDLLCGTTAAELHNSVDLLRGTTAAGLHNSFLGIFTSWHNGRQNFWKINVWKDSANTDRNSYIHFTKIKQTSKRWTLYDYGIKDLRKRF